MKLIITGGAGFIGSNLVRYFIQETDFTVLNLDKLTYAGNLDSLQDIATHHRYSFIKGDICDGHLLQKLFKDFHPDAVLHLAAESHVDRSIDGPGEFIRTNILGTYQLLEAAHDYFVAAGRTATDFRFIHVSTDEVFGSMGVDDCPFHESTPYKPRSPYSASKASSDHLARAWASTYQLPVIVTNCSNNYGPYQFPEKLIPVVILKCLREEPIPVYGDGKNMRDWLFVEDHCRALDLVLQKGTIGETYNIGGNNDWSNLDLVLKLCSIMDEKVPRKGGSTYRELISFVKDRPGHDLRYSIDAAKIREELGWQPKEHFLSGFEKTVTWYLQNRQWWEAILNRDHHLERIGTGKLLKA